MCLRPQPSGRTRARRSYTLEPSPASTTTIRSTSTLLRDTDRRFARLQRRRGSVDPHDLPAHVADADRLPDLEVCARVAGARQRSGDLAGAEPERQRQGGGDRTQEHDRDGGQRRDGDAGLSRRAQPEQDDHEHLHDRPDRDREVELRRRPLDPCAQERREDDADQHKGERRKQPRDEEDALVEGVAQELKAEKRHRGEDHDDDDRQPDGSSHQRGEGGAETGLRQQLARPRAVGETVEPRADERAPHDPADQDGCQQADDQQQQRATHPGKELAELVAGSLEHARHHERRPPRPLLTASASADVNAATRPPSARRAARHRTLGAGAGDEIVGEARADGRRLASQQPQQLDRARLGGFGRRFRRIAHCGSSQS